MDKGKGRDRSRLIERHFSTAMSPDRPNRRPPPPPERDCDSAASDLHMGRTVRIAWAKRKRN